MATHKIRDILIPFLSVCLILGTSILVIAYGRGYRIDFLGKSLKPTGLLAATSDPTGAQILVDGELKSATNNTINIAPGWYTVSIAKEGYQAWTKQIGIKGEVVSRADAYLFPTSPSLSAITTSGITTPSLSPDGSKLVYIIPATQESSESALLTRKTGIFVLDLADRPLGLNRDAVQIADAKTFDISGIEFFWSPDSKQILVKRTPEFSEVSQYFLLDSDRLNTAISRVYNLEDIQAQWDELEKLKKKEKLSGLPLVTQETITTYMDIISFSPDETKILYEASTSGTIPQLIIPPLIGSNTTEESRTISEGNIYTYDIKEDRNYFIGKDQNFIWLPTNRHLIYVSKEKIDVMDYDKTNQKTIYSGPFQDNFVVPWSNASKVLILTTLNASTGSLPNLYAVNLR